MNDFEQYLNQLQLNLMLLVIIFSYELDIILTRYDFLEAWGVIFSIVRTNSNLTWFYFWLISAARKLIMLKRKHAKVLIRYSESMSA